MVLGPAGSWTNIIHCAHKHMLVPDHTTRLNPPKILAERSEAYRRLTLAKIIAERSEAAQEKPVVLPPPPVTEFC